jgi:hypothetical protein
LFQKVFDMTALRFGRTNLSHTHQAIRSLKQFPEQERKETGIFSLLETNMKHISLLLFISLASSAFAQEQTLFDGNLESGGFGGPVVKFTQIQKEFGLMVGGYGGWLINHQFMIGGGGFGIATEHKASAEAMNHYAFPRTMYLEMGYGGGMLEYIFMPNSLLHGYFNVLIGAGAVSFRESHYDWNEFDDHRGSDAFFVVEPSINAELNLTTWMRLGAGVSYRYVTGIDELVGIANSDLSGPSGSITLKFGSF